MRAILCLKDMGKALRKATAFIHGVFRGIGSPADTFTVNVYAYPHESELEAMRTDWIRVGNMLKDSMKRADVQRATTEAR